METERLFPFRSAPDNTSVMCQFGVSRNLHSFARTSLQLFVQRTRDQSHSQSCDGAWRGVAGVIRFSNISHETKPSNHICSFLCPKGNHTGDFLPQELSFMAKRERVASVAVCSWGAQLSERAVKTM